MATMNGIAGLNVRTLGVSRDMTLSATMQMGSKWLLAQDDPELVWMALANGVSVIYRQSGDDADHNPLPPENATDQQIKDRAIGFVQTRAEKGATLVHLTNELSSTPTLHKFTRYALEYASSIGVKLVIYNYATNAPAKQWQEALPNILYAIAHGHYIGFHFYPDGVHDNGGFGWLDLKRQVGGKWICTEFNYCRNIETEYEHGWRGKWSEDQLIAFFEKWLPLFDAENVPVLIFSFDDWRANSDGKANGLGIHDAAKFIKTVGERLNVEHTLGADPAPNPNPVPPANLAEPYSAKAASNINLRSKPTTNGSTVVRTLTPNEAVVVYRSPMTDADGYQWVWVETAKGDEGYCAVQVKGVESFNPPVIAPAPPQTFKLQNPIGCAHVISSKFGVPRDYDGDGVLDDVHEGLDITRAHSDCTPLILAAADGTVTEVSSVGAYGNHVKIKSVNGADTYVLWYCHMSHMFVAAGQAVKVGDPIGVMGSTGNSTGLHLHLNCQKVGAPTPAGSPVPNVIDPLPLIVW